MASAISNGALSAVDFMRQSQPVDVDTTSPFTSSRVKTVGGEEFSSKMSSRTEEGGGGDSEIKSYAPRDFISLGVEVGKESKPNKVALPPEKIEMGGGLQFIAGLASPVNKVDVAENSNQDEKDTLENKEHAENIVSPAAHKKATPQKRGGRTRQQLWRTLSGSEKLRNASDATFEEYSNQAIDDVDAIQIKKDVQRSGGLVCRSVLGMRNADGDVVDGLSDALRAQVDTSLLRLERILRAYCARNSLLGYVQGQHAIACAILSVERVDDEAAFWILCAIAERIIGNTFYLRRPRLLGLCIDTEVVAHMLSVFVPRLSAYLPDSDDVQALASLLCAKWLIPLFIDELPMESALRLLDCVFLSNNQFSSLPSLHCTYHLRFVVAVVSYCLESEDFKAMWKGNEMPETAFMFKCLTTFVRSIGGAQMEVLLCRAYEIQYTSRQLASKRLALNRSPKFVRKELRSLSRCTHFTIAQLEEFRAQFDSVVYEQRRSGLSQLGSGKIVNGAADWNGIKLDKFTDIVGTVCPNFPLERFQDLFHALERDEKVGFMELIVGLSILSSGSIEERLRLVFDVCDKQRTGRLNHAQMAVLAETLFHVVSTFDTSKKRANKILCSLDREKDRKAKHATIAVGRRRDSSGEYKRRSTDSFPSPEVIAAAQSSRRRSVPAAMPQWGSESYDFMKRIIVMDADADGFLSFEEFKLGMHASPDLLWALQKMFPSHTEAAATNNDTSGKIRAVDAKTPLLSSDGTLQADSSSDECCAACILL